MPDEQGKLADLFPKANPCGQDADLALAGLPAFLVAPAPDPALVESVRQLGVLERIKVVADGDDGWLVFDGRRRVLAARAAGLTTIPARVYAVDDVNHHALTLVLNQQRHPNVLAEYESVKALVAQGYDEASIARETGISRGTITKRLRLGNLHEELFGLLSARLITPAVAERAAALPLQAQERLLATFEETNHVTAQDVRNVTRQRRAAAAAALPKTLFEPIAPPWHEQVRAHLTTALAAVPAGNLLGAQLLAIVNGLAAGEYQDE